MCRPGRHLSRIDSRVLGLRRPLVVPPPLSMAPGNFFRRCLGRFGCRFGLACRVERRAAFGDGCMSVCETTPWLPGTLAARFSIYLW